MTTDFNSSKTRENLMRAFAGESQARNRYTFAASCAKKNGLAVVEAVFRFTASQEEEHAEIFYNHLSSLAGTSITIDGTYPVDPRESLEAVLRAAEHNEHEEYADVYQAFGDTAREEGFLEAASAFYQIAEVEHVHEKRFGKLAQMLEDNTWYKGTEVRKWMCTNCGYIHEGNLAPELCPVCRHEKGYFLPYELACYKAETPGK